MLGEFHDGFPRGVQELQRNRRLSILWLVLDLPHLFVRVDQFHLVLVDHPLIIRRKAEILGLLRLNSSSKEDLPVVFWWNPYS